MVYPDDNFSALEIFVKSRLPLVDRFTYLGIVTHKTYDSLMRWMCSLQCSMLLISWGPGRGYPWHWSDASTFLRWICFQSCYTNTGLLPIFALNAIVSRLTNFPPFLWRNQTSRLSRDMPKPPYEHGAWHSWICIFIMLRYRYPMPHGDLEQILEAALVGSYEALANLVYREEKYQTQRYTSIMAATVVTWKLFVGVHGGREENTKWSPYIFHKIARTLFHSRFWVLASEGGKILTPKYTMKVAFGHLTT